MSRDHGQMRRRDFLKVSAGAFFAQAVPAWEARPTNPKTIRPVSIDMHTHWAPEAYVKAQIEMGRPAPANRNPLDFDLDKRRKWMDEHGIQMHVLTLSGGMPWQWATPEQGVRLAQLVNDAAIEAHTAFPDRFVAGIAMPVKDRHGIEGTESRRGQAGHEGGSSAELDGTARLFIRGLV